MPDIPAAGVTPRITALRRFVNSDTPDLTCISSGVGELIATVRTGHYLRTRLYAMRTLVAGADQEMCKVRRSVQHLESIAIAAQSLLEAMTLAPWTAFGIDLSPQISALQSAVDSFIRSQLEEIAT